MLPADSLWREILSESLELAIRGGKSWVADLQKFLTHVDYDGAAFQPGLGQLIDEDRALSLLLVKYDQVWQGLHMSPRQAPSRPRFTTYLR